MFTFSGRLWFLFLFVFAAGLIAGSWDQTGWAAPKDIPGMVCGPDTANCKAGCSDSFKTWSCTTFTAIDHKICVDPVPPDPKALCKQVYKDCATANEYQGQKCNNANNPPDCAPCGVLMNTENLAEDGC